MYDFTKTCESRFHICDKNKVLLLCKYWILIWDDQVVGGSQSYPVTPFIALSVTSSFATTKQKHTGYTIESEICRKSITYPLHL